MTKHTILFLAANPVGTDRLTLDEEARAIRVALERSRCRDQFHLEMRGAARPLDLLDELRKLKPTIVHFSGHGGTGELGSRSVSRRDVVALGAVAGEIVGGAPPCGLFFQSPDGDAQFVSAAAIEQAFGAAGSSVKLVVLSACYSDEQAEALLAHVDCVVGMHGRIGDDAARNFAIGFYGGLGERESVAAAYRQGCAAIGLEGLPDSEKPRLEARVAIDPTQLVLARNRTPSAQAWMIGRREVPTFDSRLWGIVGLTAFATVLIAYLFLGRESSRIGSFGDTLPQVYDRTSPAAPLADLAPSIDAGRPSDALLQPAVAQPEGCPSGMVSVPGGRFQMGSPDGVGYADEHPQHEVVLSTYCIDKTEVTVKAYAACVAAKGCSPALHTMSDSLRSAADQARRSQFCNRDDRPAHPINCVDWNQANAFCTWAEKRLPSEAEWEYAARGGEGRIYPWGNQPPSAKRVNACGTECAAMLKRLFNESAGKMYDARDGWETTAPVGSFPNGSSPFGALDMVGNVWEWTADWYSAYPSASAATPHSARNGTLRVSRGGGWISRDPGRVRAATRYGFEPASRYSNVGFRCAWGPT